MQGAYKWTSGPTELIFSFTSAGVRRCPGSCGHICSTTSYPLFAPLPRRARVALFLQLPQFLPATVALSGKSKSEYMYVGSHTSRLRWEQVACDIYIYCAISINSAGPVTRDSPAEILVSARRQNVRDSMFFRHIGKIFEDFCGILSLSLTSDGWGHSVSHTTSQIGLCENLNSDQPCH